MSIGGGARFRADRRRLASCGPSRSSWMSRNGPPPPCSSGSATRTCCAPRPSRTRAAAPPGQRHRLDHRRVLDAPRRHLRAQPARERQGRASAAAPTRSSGSSGGRCGRWSTPRPRERSSRSTATSSRPTGHAHGVHHGRLDRLVARPSGASAWSVPWSASWRRSASASWTACAVPRHGLPRGLPMRRSTATSWRPAPGRMWRYRAKRRANPSAGPSWMSC